MAVSRHKKGSTGVVEACASMETSQYSDADFTVRVGENQRRVFQIAYSVVGNAADAEEVAQETFLSAYRKFSSLRDAQKFRAWVNRIAFRLALNRQRTLRRWLVRDTSWYTQSARDGMIDGTTNAERGRLLNQLHGEIDRLPERLRRVLQLSIVEEMNAADVSAILGIPEGTVRSRLHTARGLLLKAMQ